MLPELNKSSLMIFGRNPGVEEDSAGSPFVGPAGMLLDSWIVHIGRRREEFIIENIVACHSPENRAPLPDEVEACWHWSQQEIELIKPKAIIALGLLAIKRLTGITDSISKLQGRIFGFGDLFSRGVPVFCLPHPSYFLHMRAAWRNDQGLVEALHKLKGFLEGLK